MSNRLRHERDFHEAEMSFTPEEHQFIKSFAHRAMPVIEDVLKRYKDNDIGTAAARLRVQQHLDEAINYTTLWRSDVVDHYAAAIEADGPGLSVFRKTDPFRTIKEEGMWRRELLRLLTPELTRKRGIDDAAPCAEGRWKRDSEIVIINNRVHIPERCAAQCGNIDSPCEWWCSNSSW